MLGTTTFRAMGTEVTLMVAAPHLPAGTVAELLHQAEALFAEYERVMSRFRPESELSRVNRRAGAWVRVSPLLFEVIRLACRAAGHTAGRFDPTLGLTLSALGYDRSFELLADEGEAAPEVPARPATWATIELDARRRAVRLPRGVALDLGGIAKGYTADAVARFLRRHGPALVDAGGDICALGRPPGEPAWRIGVASPFEPEQDLARLQLSDAACATSTTVKRRWQRAGRHYHHILDPRTNRPAESDLVSVTVVAPTAAAAEVHAKVALVLGRDAAAAAFATRPDLAAILVTTGGEALMTPTMERWLARAPGEAAGHQDRAIPGAGIEEASVEAKKKRRKPAARGPARSPR
ncbi:MAG: FAD:protein FMN transferase [Ardenticatenaceae bacterium]|nr:FAD:protein FMN transferase [Ardenticatenaceae bacterium]